MAIGPPRTHVVRPGETALDIARIYGISPVQLAQYNPGVDLARLQPGQTLNLPPGASPGPGLVVAPGTPLNPGYGAKR